MNIRTATLDDLQAVTAVEAACFPAAEAASEERMRDRISHFGDHFWLLFDDDGTLISFVDGMVTGKGDLTDDLYADASLHDEKGAWQMIFGVNTLLSYRKRGYAGNLLQKAIDDARKEGRQGVVLTCKEKLLHYYAKFGFENEGLSTSEHGGAVWYQMRLTFE